MQASATSRAANFSAWSDPVSLGAAINATCDDDHPTCDDRQPTLSKDGLTLYFASNRRGSVVDPKVDPKVAPLLDIWVAHFDTEKQEWGTPVNVGAPINTPLSDFAPALSRDEHWLFFCSTNRRGGFGSADIWASWRENVHDDFGWQEPVNLGPGINTSGFEGGPAYFENGELGVPQLYYNHNKDPISNGSHIFVSAQASDGSWGPGTPVAELNSAADHQPTLTDQRPSVSHSGLDIYFFSNRPDGSVNTDIWSSTRASVLDPWSPPTNEGLPINTKDPESHPFIFSRGQIEELYFVRTVPGKRDDLYVSRRIRTGHGGGP